MDESNGHDDETDSGGSDGSSVGDEDYWDSDEMAQTSDDETEGTEGGEDGGLNAEGEGIEPQRTHAGDSKVASSTGIEVSWYACMSMTHSKRLHVEKRCINNL